MLPRLLLQGAAVAAVIFTASSDLRIVAACPLWIERGLLLLAGLWFVNLVNFMDGLDWMTVAEVVPITAALLLLGSLREFPAPATLVAAALCGAMIGFAPFNRPVAKIFLGDVGSLPIGLLLGWCLLQLGYDGHYAAALLLPMYYLFDATATLLRRMARREAFWAAHRSHFYQRATDNGFTVWRVVGEVFALNVVLAALAIGSVAANSIAVEGVLLIAGVYRNGVCDVQVRAAALGTTLKQPLDPSSRMQKFPHQFSIACHGVGKIIALRDEHRAFAHGRVD